MKYFIIGIPINGNKSNYFINEFDGEDNKEIKAIRKIASKLVLGENWIINSESGKVSLHPNRQWEVFIFKGKLVDIGKVTRKKLEDIESFTMPLNFNSINLDDFIEDEIEAD